jgi:carbamoyl-phosphate synthase small subunit
MYQRTFLVLEDGTVYPGSGFGYPAPAIDELDPSIPPLKNAGEVVFNTAMSGYHEVLTDPSYTGQLVTMTYPHIGNYGSLDEWSEIGPETGVRRDGVKAAGFILRDLYRGPVPEGRQTLDGFLHRNRTPGISDVDTRGLTLKLRDEGSKKGLIVRGDKDGLEEAEKRRILDYLAHVPEMLGRNLVTEVGALQVTQVNPHGSPHIALLDCGAKANILRELSKRGCKLTLLPSTTTAQELDRLGPDALFVSNGPGDPAVLESMVELLKSQLGRRPLLGICLGHQLLAEAMGAKTYKMKFGHHGVNHPVRDELTKRVFVTSQNHGFAVDETTLPEDATVWFRNANDKTIEGLMASDLRVATSQFHPEACPGPEDAAWIFTKFIETAQG